MTRDGVTDTVDTVAGFTVNVVDAPVNEPAFAMMLSLPAFVSVTDCELRTPDTKEPDVVGLMPPRVFVKVTVPVNDVTVLPNESWAIILMLNGTPAVWPPSGLPDVSVITNLASSPGLTVNVVIAEGRLPEDAMIVGVPVSVSV